MTPINVIETLKTTKQKEAYARSLAKTFKQDVKRVLNVGSTDYIVFNWLLENATTIKTRKTAREICDATGLKNSMVCTAMSRLQGHTEQGYRLVRKTGGKASTVHLTCVNSDKKRK